ncbi:MAG TPA: hypothetical protein VMP01_19915 [Pirellulaceae bacterium]|nr:hypothetical protein [Pirellulaceae bacterium]
MPKRTTVLVDYGPQLAFYTHMDAVGLEIMKSGFPDWARSGLALELQDRKGGRRYFHDFQKCLFEYDWQSDWVQVANDAKSLIPKVPQQIGVNVAKKVSIHGRYALETPHSFETAVDVFRKRMFNTTSVPEEVHGREGVIFDLAYHAFVRFPGDGEAHFSIGVMTRKEWREKVTYAAAMYPPGGPPQELLTKNLPDPLVSFEVERVVTDFSVDAIPDFIDRAIEHQQSCVRRFVEYFNKGK